MKRILVLLLAILPSCALLRGGEDLTGTERAIQLVERAERAAIVLRDGYASTGPDGTPLDAERAQAWARYVTLLSAVETAMDPLADPADVIDAALEVLAPALTSNDPGVRESALELQALLTLLLP